MQWICNSSNSFCFTICLQLWVLVPAVYNFVTRLFITKLMYARYTESQQKFSISLEKVVYLKFIPRRRSMTFLQQLRMRFLKSFYLSSKEKQAYNLSAVAILNYKHSMGEFMARIMAENLYLSRWKNFILWIEAIYHFTKRNENYL